MWSLGEINDECAVRWEQKDDVMPDSTRIKRLILGTPELSVLCILTVFTAQ